MGGYGSGRHGHKHTAEHYRSIDANKMKRSGSLTEGASGQWQWLREGETIAQIDYMTRKGYLELSYRYRETGNEWEPVIEHVRLSDVPRHFGGVQTYFKCPAVVDGRACNRQVSKLYAGGRYFLCRHCYNLAYYSQSEDRADRMLRRANKIRVALGGERGTANWIAPKPKGMWQRTYQRKRFEIGWCENQADVWFIEKYSHFLSMDERRMFFDD